VNKRFITVIILFLSLSMAGFMVMQAVWINNEWKSRREDFDKDVKEALSTVAERLETQEAALVLSERLDLGLSPRAQSAAHENPADSGAKERGGVAIRSYSQTSTFRYTIFDTVKKQSESFIVSGNFFSAGVSGHTPVNEPLQPGTDPQQMSRVGAKTQQFSNVFNRLVMEWNLVNIPVEQRVNADVLHEMIRQELEKKGIDLPFHFGVMKGGHAGRCVVRSDDFAEQMIPASFSTALFPNDITLRSDRLMVFFDDVRPYIVRSMWWMLVLSGILLLVFGGTFFTAVYVILKQKRLSEVKSDFINNMTHEFKTPIATISLALDSIRNPRVAGNEEKVRYYSDIISRENKRMNKQVESILQMSLLDRENLELNPQLLNVNELIAAVAEPFELQVNSRGGKLQLELEAENPFILADEVHFTNVLHNLLDNANKYSRESPQIVVSTRSEQGRLQLVVEDKGIGMSSETQRKIFEKFYRAQSGNVHDVKGFGLGLAYVKSIIQKHGGSIQVTSQPGAGSRFVITMPYGHRQNDHR
jgi:two-component system phosphate regulon sensor histidine kinase PhoR